METELTQQRWCDPSLDDFMKKRNEARNDSKDNESRANWRKLDKECNDAINNAKKESWREFTKEIDTSTNPNAVW